jgi:hypothetical protein
MSSGPLHNRSILPLRQLETWAPFHLDALGLVTLIGAEDVSKAIGRLVRSRYTTFLPLLGAYLIAGSQFTESSPGFTLYEVNDSIKTSSISGWFGRWLSSQEIQKATTTFEWTHREGPRKMSWFALLTNSIGLWLLAGLTVLAIIMGDFWGLSNALAMFVSVMVRWYLVRENVLSLDDSSKRAFDKKDPDYQNFWKETVRCFIELPNGDMVTLIAPERVVIDCIVRTPAIRKPRSYQLATRLGWLSFGVHIIAIGQSNLVSQICAIVLLTISSWLTVHGVGCNESKLGKHITLERRPPVYAGILDRRMCAYAVIEPAAEEEEAMIGWGLLPRKSNREWWDIYENFKQDYHKRKEEAAQKQVTSSSSPV